MTEQELEKFIEHYKFINKRCEEYLYYTEPDEWYEGFEVEEDSDSIRINYSHTCYGEYERDYCYVSSEEIFDENVNIKEKFGYLREEWEWKKMLEQEKKEQREKRQAIYEINRLKKQYGIN